MLRCRGLAPGLVDQLATQTFSTSLVGYQAARSRRCCPLADSNQISSSSAKVIAELALRRVLVKDRRAMQAFGWQSCLFVGNQNSSHLPKEQRLGEEVTMLVYRGVFVLGSDNGLFNCALRCQCLISDMW